MYLLTFLIYLTASVYNLSYPADKVSTLLSSDNEYRTEVVFYYVKKKGFCEIITFRLMLYNIYLLAPVHFSLPPAFE